MASSRIKKKAKGVKKTGGYAENIYYNVLYVMEVMSYVFLDG